MPAQVEMIIAREIDASWEEGGFRPIFYENAELETLEASGSDRANMTDQKMM